MDQSFMARPARVDIVVPVYNEARILADSIRTLSRHLERTCPYDWRIVIADNASTDATPAVMHELTLHRGRVEGVRIETKGRGVALKAAWRASNAAVHAYMDVDLSTGLDALGPLLQHVLDGSDVAIGSRYVAGAEVTRGLKRATLSRAYNHLLRACFHTSISDAQCGFKAVSHRVVQELLPRVQSDGWFFDSELLLLAERAGYRIAEVPVRWVEDADSRVRIGPTILEYLGEIRRLRRMWGAARAAPGVFRGEE